MAAEKAPAFQFYPNDFLMDGNVAGMSLQERGAYITLLCICWKERSLPSDPVKLARMVGVPNTVFRRLWPALKPCFNGRRLLTHKRLDAERVKQQNYRKAQSDKGIKGAAARWPVPSSGHTTGITDGVAEGMPGDGSSVFDLQTAVTKNPPTPFQGALTKKELRRAAEIRKQVHGRCPHEVRCENYDQCVETIAHELRAKAS